MASILDKVSLGPGVLNPFGGAQGGAPFRGEVSDGISKTKEVVASTIKFLSEALTPYEVLGQVVIEPKIIQKSKIMNYFTTDFLGLDDEATVREYMKVYVRVPMEHTSLPVTKALTDVMSRNANEEGVVANFVSAAADYAIIQLYPYFLAPVGEKENGISAPPPKVGDIVKVKYTDVLRTRGIFVEVIERIQMLSDTDLQSAYGSLLGDASSGERLSSQELMELMNVPIDSVFATDLGPPIPNVEKLPRAPDEVLNSLCEGNTITLSNGDTLDTVILDNRLVPVHVAPYLIAMLLEGERELGSDWWLNSCLRVMFSSDKITAGEFNAATTALLEDGTQCKNWNGKPMFGAGNAPDQVPLPASQQEAAEINCSPQVVTLGEPNKYEYKNCSPPTLSWDQTPSRGNHITGEAVDMHLGGDLGISTHASDPARMTRQYRWLSLNAYKFGFIRGVRSERWHWEFHPSEYNFSTKASKKGYPIFHMFTKVGRDNPQWDGQFTTAEYMDEYANPAGESLPEEEFPAEDEFSAESLYSPESSLIEQEVGKDPCQENF